MDFFLNLWGHLRAVLAGLVPWWPVLVGAIAVEVLRPGKRLHWPTVIANSVYIPLGLAVGSTVLSYVLPTLDAQVPPDVLRLREWANTPTKQVALWLLYLACFDFLYYWLHRAQHRIPWLWRYHMVHHSDVNVSASCVGRHHWLEEGFRYFIVTAPLVVLMGGAHGAPVWVLGFIVLNGIFMHWNVSFRFGVLERLVITPAYHRLHHSIEERHYDTNFGVFTQLWDHVFSTRKLPARDDYPETGIVGLSSTRSWALLAPWPILLVRKNAEPPSGPQSL